MNNNECQDKKTLIRGLKDILNASSSNLMVNKNNLVSPCSNSKVESGIVLSKPLSKSVKTFVEQSLVTELNNQVAQIQNANKETWKVDAYNLSKAFTDESKLSCIQDNLTNILDSCLKEFDETGPYNFHDTDIDVSPLLQPEHIIEIAECMSSEKPLDVRLNALRVLCKSHFTDAINGEGWTLLQKKLVENLSDNNTEIFVMSLKAHAKLASCSSPEAIKECSLNLVEGLGRHYYLHQGECKSTSFESIHFYRSVYLVFLLLRTFKEVTANVGRFGEGRLQEMIENFIELISINVSPIHTKNQPFISPLELVSFLDPYAKWMSNLTHFNLSRKLFFSSICKNINFVRICTEEVLSWLEKPIIPSSTNISNISEGELNFAVHKFSLFCHSLASLSRMCSFGLSTSLFPIRTSKKEDLLSMEDIIDMLITTINDKEFSDILHTKATSEFKSFFALNLAKMLCFQHINGNLFMLKFLKSEDSQNSILNPIKVEILFTISDSCEFNNPFICCDLMQKKKKSLFSHCFVLNKNTASNQASHGSVRQRQEVDDQGSLGDVENSDACPFEIYLNYFVQIAEQNMLTNDPRIIIIITNNFKNFDKLHGINYALKSQITQIIGEVYRAVSEKFEHQGSKVDLSDINLSNICAQFLLQVGNTSLGFFALQKCELITCILQQELKLPEPNWSNRAWLNFVCKAATTEEGFNVLSPESNNILKRELLHLWDIIDEDCSGSELPIKECSRNVLKIVTVFTLSLNGVKALLNEVEDGSEVTLTDDWEIRPSNLFTLIRNFALNQTNCPDLLHHQFSLIVLDQMVSNIDTNIYLLNKFDFQEVLLRLQAENRVDENSDVIIDECSLLRQKIIEKTFIPSRHQPNLKPTYTFPRPESTLTRTKPRSRGSGEFARWLSETRPGVHDNSWLKHTRKLYRNSSSDDVKGTIILDLLEQVLKVLPETKSGIKLNQQIVDDSCSLSEEEQLAIQLVVRFGSHHRIFQATQTNFDNLSQLILVVKTSLNTKSDDFKGFDWFVASCFLLGSGSAEKAQSLLTLMSSLPTAPLIWSHFSEALNLAQLGNVLEIIISEEMPALFQVLEQNGLSWWQLCSSWMAQCWWGVLDWSLICHWLITAILYQADHLLYFCAALLHSNHDRLLQMAHEGTVYEIISNPAENFHLIEAKTLIDKLHKKYHGTLHSYLVSL